MIRLPLILLLLITSAVLADPPTHRFRPVAPSIPSEDIDSARQLIETGQFIRAIEKLQPFLADPAEPLARVDEDAAMSLPAWFATFTDAQRKGLADAWRARFDTAARNALQDLRRIASASPREFHAIARRYPLSSFAGEACAEAGRRSAALGDAQGAAAYYGLAAEAGWTADAEHVATLKACRDLLNQLADPASYRGPIVFDATWFNQPGRIHFARYHPHAHDGTIFIAASRHLLAMRETGQVLWQASSADAWSPAFTPDQVQGLGRGAGYAPAIFASPAGPQIIVVRQPGAGGRNHALRAFRAADGTLLWRTDGQPAFERISIVSNPAIAGRFVYAAAVQFTEESATLVLLALDLLDGSIVFTCPLGTMADMRQSRPVPRQWDGFWEQSEPAIAEDSIYLTPNVGVAFCVGRFDGRIRWARAYDPTQRGFANRNPREVAGIIAAEPAPRPADDGQLLRYRSTPQLSGRTLIIAPQDTPAALALDARTGQLLWHQPDPPAHTLIATTAGRAIFAGQTVAALDTSTGQPAWTFIPPKPAHISGPPALIANTLFVPASDIKIHLVNPETGLPAAAALKHPNFRLLVHSANGRKTLTDTMVLPTLGSPPRP